MENQREKIKKLIGELHKLAEKHSEACRKTDLILAEIEIVKHKIFDSVWRKDHEETELEKGD